RVDRPGTLRTPAIDVGAAEAAPGTVGLAPAVPEVEPRARHEPGLDHERLPLGPVRSCPATMPRLHGQVRELVAERLGEEPAAVAASPTWPFPTQATPTWNRS